MSIFKQKYHYLLAPSVYLLISYLCLTSKPFPSSMDFSFLWFANIDKLVHAGLYFMATKATLVQLAIMGKLENRKLKIIWSVVVPISFGLMVELVQHFFIPGRSGDVTDFLANTIGVVVAYFSFKVLSNRLSSKSRGR